MSINLTTYKVKHEFTLYKNSIDDFIIARYQVIEDTPTRPKGAAIIAKGNSIPEQKNLAIVLNGEWKQDRKRGEGFFAVNSFSVELPSTKNGVISFFASLRIGIGAKTAARIYKTFGEQVWDIVENNPDKLTSVRGVSSKVVAKLKDKIIEVQMMSKLMAKFGSCEEMTPYRARKIFNAYGNDSLAILEENPFRLCEVKGFSFQAVDALANSLPNWDPKRPERISAGIQALMQIINQQGHTCMPIDETVNCLDHLLRIQDKACCRDALNDAFKKHQIRVKGNYCYSNWSFITEKHIASNTLRLVRENPRYHVDEDDLDKFLAAFEEENNIQLAMQQKEAVKQCFSGNLNIITGGPGTGKSTIIKAILFVAEIVDPDNRAILMAPTGRAARRMQEATGHEASTIHSALGIRYSGNESDSDGEMETNEPLDADMVIIDEVSMIDQNIASKLLDRIGSQTAVILVGDCDQLPSVGPGAILAELIKSEIVPVSRLNVIFRQRAGDPIIINSRKILKGDTALLEAPTFRIFQRDNAEDTFRAACKFYLRCVDAYGLDDVVLLVPFRKKGSVCVDRFNVTLEKEINPGKPEEMTMKVLGREFHAGDKIMQTVNTDFAKNGDVGYILSVDTRPSKTDADHMEKVCVVQFDGSPVLYYTEEDMMQVDWAYAQSIHKSQGQEYQHVILAMCSEHQLMARRNLFYTAVTRSKKNVALIGDRRTFNFAIENQHVEMRYTQLSDFIKILDKTVPEHADPRYYHKRK